MLACFKSFRGRRAATVEERASRKRPNSGAVAEPPRRRFARDSTFATPESAKPRLNLAIIGHVDSGKSTVAGHLLYECGAISDRALEGLAQEAAELGKQSFKYAFTMDRLRSERERGVSIECSLAKLVTHERVLTLIDAPGHVNFVKNLLSGLAQADTALLVVDASPGAFEAGFSENGGNTRTHPLLAYSMGVQCMVVAVNKMDAVDFSEARFAEIVNEVSAYLLAVGFRRPHLQFVPVSGWTGANLAREEPRLDWYRGPTLLQALDALPVPARTVDGPLRLSVFGAHKIAGVGVVVTGRVQSGTLRQGAMVHFSRRAVSDEVLSIEFHHARQEEAVAGDFVGFCMHGFDTRGIRRGDVCGDAENRPRSVASFEAQVIVLSVPNEIRAGYSPVLSLGSAHVPCRWAELQTKLDRRTGAVLEEPPQFLRKGECAQVKLVPLKPICVEPFRLGASLGRFVMRDSGKVVAVGVAKTVEYLDDEILN